MSHIEHNHMVASVKLALFRRDISRREMAHRLKVDPSRVYRALQGDTAQASILASIAEELWGERYQVHRVVRFTRLEDPARPKMPV